MNDDKYGLSGLNDEEKCTRIAEIIDPDGTFLNQCEEAVNWRFGNEGEE